MDVDGVLPRREPLDHHGDVDQLDALRGRPLDQEGPPGDVGIGASLDLSRGPDSWDGLVIGRGGSGPSENESYGT